MAQGQVLRGFHARRLHALGIFLPSLSCGIDCFLKVSLSSSSGVGTGRSPRVGSMGAS